jgi:hypothetical protein
MPFLLPSFLFTALFIDRSSFTSPFLVTSWPHLVISKSWLSILEEISTKSPLTCLCLLKSQPSHLLTTWSDSHGSKSHRLALQHQVNDSVWWNQNTWYPWRSRLIKVWFYKQENEEISLLKNALLIIVDLFTEVWSSKTQSLSSMRIYLSILEQVEWIWSDEVVMRCEGQDLSRHKQEKR